MGQYVDVSKTSFILIFDIQREMQALKRQTHRLLIRSGSKEIQFSVWSSDNLRTLISIASSIKRLVVMQEY